MKKLGQALGIVGGVIFIYGLLAIDNGIGVAIVSVLGGIALLFLGSILDKGGCDEEDFDSYLGNDYDFHQYDEKR